MVIIRSPLENFLASRLSSKTNIERRSYVKVPPPRRSFDSSINKLAKREGKQEESGEWTD